MKSSHNINDVGQGSLDQLKQQITQSKKEDVKLAKKIILDEYKLSYKENNRAFKYDDVLEKLQSICERQDIKLQDIRLNLSKEELNISDNINPAIFNDMTLLHVLMLKRDIQGVQKLITSDIKSESKDYDHTRSIPPIVKHSSTNNLLHFAGLMALNDAQHNKIYNDPINKPLNIELIEIVKLLSDSSRPDYLEINAEESLRHADGGTHMHSAFISGALDLALFFRMFCSTFNIPRTPTDKLAPVDFAASRNLHMDSYEKLAVYEKQMGLSNPISTIKNTTNSSQSILQSLTDENKLAPNKPQKVNDDQNKKSKVIKPQPTDENKAVTKENTKQKNKSSFISNIFSKNNNSRKVANTGDAKENKPGWR